MPAGPHYERIEHTADIGVEVDGGSPAELFANAAWAMADLIAGARGIRPLVEEHVSLQSGDYEELLVRWLSEFLFLFETRRLLFSQFHIGEIDARHLEADVRGEEFSPGRHEAHYDIKAVTYFGLHVEERDGTWRARVIFDI